MAHFHRKKWLKKALLMSFWACMNAITTRGLAALPPRGGPWKLESGSGQNSRLIQRRELGGGLKLLGLRKFP